MTVLEAEDFVALGIDPEQPQRSVGADVLQLLELPVHEPRVRPDRPPYRVPGTDDPLRDPTPVPLPGQRPHALTFRAVPTSLPVTRT
ncbi:hypothetical protein [Streptomyces sp. NPDC001076]